MNVVDVRQAGKAGRSYWCPDRRADGHVVVFAERARIEHSDEHRDFALDLDAGELQDVARLATDWRAARLGFVAYRGLGKQLQWMGYSPLLRWSSEAPTGAELLRDDPRFRRLVPDARGYAVRPAEPDRTLGGFPVTHAITSNIGDPVGVVVRGPASGCALATRRRLLVLRGWLTHDGLSSLVGVTAEGHGVDRLDARLLERGAVFLDTRLASLLEQAARDARG